MLGDRTGGDLARYGDLDEIARALGISEARAQVTAENLARDSQISRRDQERFAVASQQKAAAAQAAGRLAPEIVGIEHGGRTTDRDGCIRPDTTVEALEKLEPAFLKDGTVTAGTSSPLTDGCAALLVTSEDYADAHGLRKLARLRGTNPDSMHGDREPWRSVMTSIRL